MQNETTQATSTQEVKAKRTAKNSVFLDLFKDKKYLLALYKMLHPEDIKVTENSITDATIENVLTDNLFWAERTKLVWEQESQNAKA
ncbi:MAG: hypothetical protein NC300_12570 [Bacteroidales bacterium]|nr:hypothetical protein [Bacteroidales bacterium]